MNDALTTRIETNLAERRNAGLLREVLWHAPDSELLNLADNDYWSLAKHPQVIAAAHSALDQYGCSASASPLITGFGPAHEALLNQLKSWHGFGEGLIWNSGFAANHAVLSTLPQRGDLILADRLIHNSMVQGILNSGARLIRYQHNDLDHLTALLNKHKSRSGATFVVTESVFSMDGDYPNLRALAELKSQYGFFWFVDEAHALGWYGERGSGLVEQTGVIDQVDLLVGTLGKALASQGAYTMMHDARLAQYLVNHASEFIYSTYLSPVCAAAANAAIVIHTKNETGRRHARAMSQNLRQELKSTGLDVPPGDSPIVPIIYGETAIAESARNRLRSAGILTGLIRPPTVPAGSSRLRLSLKGNLDSAIFATIQKTLANRGLLP